MKGKLVQALELLFGKLTLVHNYCDLVLFIILVSDQRFML